MSLPVGLVGLLGRELKRKSFAGVEVSGSLQLTQHVAELDAVASVEVQLYINKRR